MAWDLLLRLFALEDVNAALTVFKRETDEERRPLFEPKKNSGDNISK